VKKGCRICQGFLGNPSSVISNREGLLCLFAKLFVTFQHLGGKLRFPFPTSNFNLSRIASKALLQRFKMTLEKSRDSSFTISNWGSSLQSLCHINRSLAAASHRVGDDNFLTSGLKRFGFALLFRRPGYAAALEVTMLLAPSYHARETLVSGLLCDILGGSRWSLLGRWKLPDFSNFGKDLIDQFPA